MPFVLRRSGPDFTRNGQTITPRAMIGQCEVCGFEPAPFGIISASRREAYCGWVNGQPTCIAVRNGAKSKDAA